MYDYIVIGSGFGDSVASLRLAEKGKRFQNNDFPETNWSPKKYLWLPSFGCYGIQKLSFFKQASILSGVRVDGGSLVYAYTLFLPPDDFYTPTNQPGFKDWKKVLRPYYKVDGFMIGFIKYDKLHREDLALRRIAEKLNKAQSFDNVHVSVYTGDPEKETDPYCNGYGPKRKSRTEWFIRFSLPVFVIIKSSSVKLSRIKH